jgi:hypothetical protein
LRQGAASTIPPVFAIHLGVGASATHHPSPLPLFVQLAAAAAGGALVLGVPRVALLLQSLATRLRPLLA